MTRTVAKAWIGRALLALVLAGMLIPILGGREAGAATPRATVTACFHFASGEAYAHVARVNYVRPDGARGYTDLQVDAGGCIRFTIENGSSVYLEAYFRPSTQTDCAWTQYGARGPITIGSLPSYNLADTRVTRTLQCSA